jgi:hypothetical protein
VTHLTPIMPKRRMELGCGAFILIAALIFALAIGQVLLFGAILMLVLQAFGVHVSFWVCTLIVVLTQALFGAVRR